MPPSTFIGVTVDAGPVVKGTDQQAAGTLATRGSCADADAHPAGRRGSTSASATSRCCTTCRSRSRPARSPPCSGRAAAARRRCCGSIAGLERPDAGAVAARRPRRSSAPARSVPPEQRRIGMVFQDWALFPHMTVARNVGYGLGRAARPGARVDEALDHGRARPASATGMPGTLSGGQQQRVALARALAPRPARAPARRAVLQPRHHAAGAGAAPRCTRLLAELGVTTRVRHPRPGRGVRARRPGRRDDRRRASCRRPRRPSSTRRPVDPWVAAFVGDANLVAGRRPPATGPTTALGAVAARPAGDRAPCEVLVRPEQLAARRGPTASAQASVVTLVEYYGHDTLYAGAHRRRRACGSAPLGAPIAPRATACASATPARAPSPSPAAPVTDALDAVVLGGGPAGLAAAWRAARGRPRGHRRRARPTASAGMAGSFARSPGSASTTAATACTRRPTPPLLADAARPARRRPAGRGRATAASGSPGAGSASRCAPATCVRNLPPPLRRRRRRATLAPAPLRAPPRRRRHVRRPGAGRPRPDGRRRVLRAVRPQALGRTAPTSCRGELARRRVGAGAPGASCVAPSRALARRRARLPLPAPAASARSPRRSADAAVAAGADVIAGVGADRWTSTERRCRRLRRRRPASRHASPCCRRCRLAVTATLYGRSSTPRRTAAAALASSRARRARLPRPRPAAPYTPFDAHYFPEARRARGPRCPSRRTTATPPTTPPTAPCCAPSCRARPPTSAWYGRRAPTLGALVATPLLRRGPARPGRRPRCTSGGVDARVPDVPPRLSGAAGRRRGVGRRPRPSSSCSGARRCSPTTTPTTPWRWARPPPAASARMARSTASAWAALRDGFRDHVVED